jgi:Family of unknown function (DUF6279)
MITTFRLMRTFLTKAFIIVATSMALLLVAGCSMVRLGYAQAPHLAYWWLDGYYDFSESQQQKARDAIAAFFAWHRKTQLPDYAQLLDRAQTEVLRDTTPARICEWNDEIIKRLNTAADHAMPDLAELVLSLSPQQLVHVQKRMDKENKEFATDYLQPAKAERLESSMKRIVDRVEMVYGSVDDAQRKLIEASVAASPFDPEAWGAEQQERQRETMRTMRELIDGKADAPRAQAAMRALADLTQRSPRPAYRAYQLKLVAYNCAFAAQIHNTMSAAQRQAAVRRFKGWAEDARALAGESNGL